jgi:hypothetical protein
MPLEWPVRPVARTSQLPELRRAIEPMSRPFSCDQPLEIERHVGALAGGDQVAARDLDRVAGILLVAGEDDLDVGVFSVPAACIARSAATITTMPPLSSPTPGPSAVSPLRTKRWNGESGSNTVSRWPISSMRLPRPLPLCVATMCPARPVSPSAPSAPEAERLQLGPHHPPDRLHAGRFSVPLFWFTNQEEAEIGIEGEHRLDRGELVRVMALAGSAACSSMP